MQESSFGTTLANDQLTAFVCVVKHLSFTSAARELELDASVVARRIVALEKQLGLRLLERTTRRMALTDAGRAFYERVLPALEGLGAAESEARDNSKQPSGLLRLSLPATFGRMWVAPLLPAFQKLYPSIIIDARFSDRYVDMVDEHFDVAIRLGLLASSNLIARKIRDYSRGLYAAPKYLKQHGSVENPASLSQHRCLTFAGFEKPSKWQLTTGDVTETIDIPITMLSDDASVLVAAATGGQGIMAATNWLVHDQVSRGDLVRTLPEWSVGVPGAAYVVVPSIRYVSAKTRAFADWIFEALRAQPPWHQ